MSISYIVKIEEFAKSHYIKKFSKKYKNSWDITIRGILLELERFDEFIKTDHIDLISCCERMEGTHFIRHYSCKIPDKAGCK